MFDYNTGRLVAGGIYTILLALAALTDFRTRRIPNRVVLALIVGGITYSLTTMSPLYGLGFSTGGLVVGLVVWLPFYALGWLGAGDVKLAAGAGAWLGAFGVLRASLIGAIIGGAISLALMLWQRSAKGVAVDMLLLLDTIRRRPRTLRVTATTAASAQLMPYGVAIALGALAAGWMGGGV